MYLCSRSERVSSPVNSTLTVQKVYRRNKRIIASTSECDFRKPYDSSEEAWLLDLASSSFCSFARMFSVCATPLFLLFYLCLLAVVGINRPVVGICLPVRP